MDQSAFLTSLKEQISTQVRSFLQEQLLSEVVSLQEIDDLALESSKVTAETWFETWATLMEELAVMWGRECPECGKPRKCRWRKNEPMEIDLLLGKLQLGKPFLSCDTPGCTAPGLSVMRLLTGLSSGDSSPVLKLEAARQAAEDSYGKARRTLKNHPFGREVERTKLRRLALEVEEEALQFAEQRRQRACAELEQEGHRAGVELLVFEGDGGKVRVGELRDLKEGEPGYGEKTEERNLDRRRRETTFREVITMDVRELGEVEPSALDVMLPVLSSEGERERRMLALAGLKGLGDNTEMYGLGDMGSGLAAAFDEAFHDHKAFWAADKKHTWDYIDDAVAVLEELDTDQWATDLRRAILERDVGQRDELLKQAKLHRVKNLPDSYERCPVHALSTYLRNNWKRMRFQEMEARGLPTVSARAEAQVRDRTKDRFSVAGAWKVENIEGKATLRAIIDESSYRQFVQWYWRRHEHAFINELRLRLQQAVQENRLTEKAAALLLDPTATVADILGVPAADQHEQPFQQRRLAA